ncbi:MAG: prepilin-type N-terminal cleavage/methylation domain-containing protein [Patescibacteria group bacterium]
MRKGFISKGDKTTELRRGGFISEGDKATERQRGGFISEGDKATERQRGGFTLLELLVVIGIIAIVGVIAADIFVNVTRSYNKAEIITRVQRSGNVALAQMTGEIRNARRVISPAPGGSDSTLTIENSSGGQVAFAFQPAMGGANGYISRDGSPISDSDYETGVNITSLTFTVLSTTPTVVGITLGLEQPLGVPGRVDFQAATSLQTSVSLRTYE